ncbi:MAG: hypothetical protein A3K19_30680 [Lentisphaerae bacterium RIFOXYB12_FULL_65_16]|nr:MAG: hypothetical protein A3K18_01090 [Lentisphaerae bacterium RIFOXYA12_64_32]OGV88784.1 MAG: hypothetical protein A3K19_30680 [Lentisphaerae bacterium RIFOXYB12_FULL_65_16]
MKTTLDIPDQVYRRVKAKCAMEGLAVREVAIGLFSSWVDETDGAAKTAPPESGTVDGQPVPAWFGALRKHAKNARGRFDMDAIRRSIAQGRARAGSRS